MTNYEISQYFKTTQTNFQHAHTLTHKHTHVHANTHARARTHTDIQTHIHAHAHARIHTHVRTRARTEREREVAHISQSFDRYLLRVFRFTPDVTTELPAVVLGCRSPAASVPLQLPGLPGCLPLPEWISGSAPRRPVPPPRALPLRLPGYVLLAPSAVASSQGPLGRLSLRLRLQVHSQLLPLLQGGFLSRPPRALGQLRLCGDGG